MNMEKKRLHKVFALIAVMALGVSLLSGCAWKNNESPQAQLPDINIEFIVDNNDLDFYKFL